MADDDTNLPDAYDLVPVDHTPQFADAPIPKAGQTVQQPNVMGDISSMPGKVASAVGDVTGVSDAYKAATGQMTPEEAQMFALGALPMLAGGPEARAAEEGATAAQRAFAKVTGAVESDPAYVYHATSVDRIHGIIDDGALKRFGPSDFTDQDVWPDGSTAKRNYFTPTAQNTWQFAPEDGQPALLRIPKDAHPFKRESGTGDLFSNKDVPISKIEALNADGTWQPLAGGPEAKVAEELAPGVAKTAKGIVQDIATYAGEHGAPDMESGSPLHNVTLNGTYPADFYSGRGLQYYAPGHDTPGVDAGVYHKIVATKDQPDQMVSAYRAIPWEGKRPQFTLNSGGPSGAVINPGDWVTLSRQYAKDHGESALNGQYAIVSKKVPARELFTNGDSYHEWGWDPRASQPQAAPEPPQPQGIRAYHGSPYDFNQFDLSKIGTGEGAQAYGHGLYFAENPSTADVYKKTLALKGQAEPQAIKAALGDAVPYDPQTANAIRSVAMSEPDPTRAAFLLQSRVPDLRDEGMSMLDNDAPKRQALSKAIALEQEAIKGHMYEVNINADPEHFLDWDKPLSEQHPKVQEALQKVGVTVPAPPDIATIPDPAIRGIVRKALRANEGQAENLGMIIDNDQGLYNSALQHAKNRGRDLDAEDERAGDYVTQKAQSFLNTLHHAQTETPASFLRRAYDNPMFAGDVVGKDQASPAELSQALADKGIPGIKYLDQGSRADGTGTRNYVVFDPKTIDIVKKYGLAGLVAGGASHFSTVPVDHQPDFPDQNGMADGGTVDDATDAPTDPTNSIAPLATALNRAVPNFDPEAAGFRPSTNIEDVRNKPLWRKAIEVITRKPLPGDLTNYAKGGGVKATKTQANYRGGTAKKRCGICSMFQPPRGCSAVRGVISPQALCDFYEPTKAEKKNDVKIDATHDGPWMSCMSIDGATMYRNKNLPATANIKGKTVDVDDMLLHHEVPEREDLEKLIAEFKARFKREPNKNERKAIYLKAHNRSGTPNERAHAKKIGVDWKAWSAWCRGEESKIEKMKFTNQPKDADVKPIPHSHDELEAMDHASAA